MLHMSSMGLNGHLSSPRHLQIHLALISHTDTWYHFHTMSENFWKWQYRKKVRNEYKCFIVGACSATHI